MPTPTRCGALVLLVGLLAAAFPTSAQAPPDLSGTWKLVPAASQVDPLAKFGGLEGNVGTPPTLYVTQARNGTVIVGSDTNTSHTRTYQPGGSAAAPFAGGEITLSAQWTDDGLVAAGGDPTAGSLREALALADGGDVLMVTITAEDAAGEHTSRLHYRRATVESPCTEWPTPCRQWNADGTQAKPPA